MSRTDNGGLDYSEDGSESSNRNLIPWQEIHPAEDFFDINTAEQNRRWEEEEKIPPAVPGVETGGAARAIKCARIDKARRHGGHEDVTEKDP
jgi:hypothetical protein